MVVPALLTVVALSAPPSSARPAPPFRWGATGHEMAAGAAADHLPADLPAFFLQARDQLVYLDPEPDRWRSPKLREMDQAWSYDHFIDLENVPEGALDAPDRYSFILTLHRDGIERPESTVGFLPYRIVELYQRLVTEWRLWREETDPVRKAWIEQRIINDAGILGHYVTDGANPHHTTIHYNGWSADAPNPEGFTTDRDFHWRFESEFVKAHVRPDQVEALVRGPTASVAGHARTSVLDYLQASHRLVVPLYRLQKEFGFDPDAPAHTETRDFVAQRLAAGADMLRTLWWSAWQESATAP